jgi:hypothetical protein
MAMLEGVTFLPEVAFGNTLLLTWMRDGDKDDWLF